METEPSPLRPGSPPAERPRRRLRAGPVGGGLVPASDGSGRAVPKDEPNEDGLPPGGALRAGSTGGSSDGGPAPRTRRAVLVGVGIGLAVGLAAVGIAVSIVAIPMYALASFEPGSGLNRSVVRTGLLQVAVPFGSLVGLAVGITVGIWKARGGSLPTDRTPIHE